MVGAVVGKGLVIKLERKAHKLCLWVKSQNVLKALLPTEEASL